MEGQIILEKIIGIFYIILGLSFMFQPSLWMDFMKAFNRSPYKLIPFSMLILPLGLFIVFYHNIWILEPKVVVTIIGWGAIIKALIALLAPKVLLGIMPSFKLWRRFYALEGVFSMALGALVIYGAIA